MEAQPEPSPVPLSPEEPKVNEDIAIPLNGSYRDWAVSDIYDGARAFLVRALQADLARLEVLLFHHGDLTEIEHILNGIAGRAEDFVCRYVINSPFSTQPDNEYVHALNSKLWAVTPPVMRPPDEEKKP